MVEYRHVGDRTDGVCTECQMDHIAGVTTSSRSQWPPCATPEPDPASPCGACNGEGQHVRPGADTWSNQRHHYVPTRCLRCGHAIEAMR